MKEKLQIFCALYGSLASKINQIVKSDSELNRKPKSRMRKLRTYGSVRSGGTQVPLFT